MPLRFFRRTAPRLTLTADEEASLREAVDKRRLSLLAGPLDNPRLDSSLAACDLLRDMLSDDLQSPRERKLLPPPLQQEALLALEAHILDTQRRYEWHQSPRWEREVAALEALAEKLRALG
jgi:hypothetical protein